MRKKLQPSVALLLLLLAGLIAEQSLVNAQSGPIANTNYSENGVSTRTDPSALSIPYRNRRIQQDVPVSVTTFSGETIQQKYITSIRDLPQITQVAGYTSKGVQTGMTTNFTLRGIGNNPDLIYVNDTRYGQGTGRNMFHSQTVISGLNGIPVYAVEQIEVLKGPQGTLFGRNATSGVVNFTTNERISSQIKDGVYNSYYLPHSVDKYDYSALQNNIYTNWRSTVDAVKLKGEYSTSIPDMTFGPNGTIRVKVVLNNDFLVEQQEYRDGNNQLWKTTDTEWYINDYYNSIKTDYYCNGQQQFTQYSFTDAYGYKNDQLKISFKNGKPDWGYFTPDPAADKTFRQYWNPSNHSFELNTTLPARLQLNDYFYNYNYKQDPEECKDKRDDKENDFYAGLSLRFEDFGNEKKIFPGINVAYTRFCKSWLGGTVDATFNFGKVNNTKYSILSAYAGPTFIPFTNSAGLKDPFTFSVHTLAGYTNIKQKYTFNNSSNSYGNFSLKLGVGGYYNLNDDLGLGLRLSDNMVFGKGSTSNNWGIDLAARFDF